MLTLSIYLYRAEVEFETVTDFEFENEFEIEFEMFCEYQPRYNPDCPISVSLIFS